jgi:hypothetical protein
MDTADVVQEREGVEDRKVDDRVEVQINLKGKDFHHPFTPYKIQEEFMETVYRVLESGEGRVGILESPTGTVGGGVSFLLFVGFCVAFHFGLG